MILALAAAAVADPEGPLSTLLGGLFDVGEGWLPGLLFLATFASEDLACVAGGMLVGEQQLAFPMAVLGCAAGIWVSDLGLYGLGWAVRHGLLRWPRLRGRVEVLQTGKLARGFESHGLRIVLLSRCVPGSRVPCYLAAGAVGWSFPRFAFGLLVGALLWTPLAVSLGLLIGDAAAGLLAEWGRSAWFAVPVALLSAWAALRLITSLWSWRGRRLWRARLRRWRSFEYWPWWVVYLPVILDQIRIGFLRLTPTLFSSCNPAIPHGGLAFESKGDILDLLPGGRDAAVQVPPYRRLPSSESLEARLAVVSAELDDSGEGGVVVLKPDIGERGNGVALVRDLDYARRWLEACPFDAVVQQYVSGVEYGIVWRRAPLRDGPGEIRSITLKQLPPPLTGDGERTIEELLLADDRQVAMFGYYRQWFGARLEEVPAVGEPVSLGELGTHCRGASFHDARSLATPALRDALDAFMADSPGLDFGRFDVRVPSEADLVAGRGLQVLEFNGITGEPAHVYEPGFPALRGLMEIVRHWRAASETGAGNRTLGLAVKPSWWQLLLLVRDLRGRTHFEAPRPNPGTSKLPNA